MTTAMVGTHKKPATLDAFHCRYYLDAALMFAHALRLDPNIKSQLDICCLVIRKHPKMGDGGWVGIEIFECFYLPRV